MAETEEVVLKLPRGNRGGIVATRVTKGDHEFVRLHELFPDPITGEIKSTRGFHFKLAELAAVGALFVATARSIEEREKKNAAEKKTDTPAAAPVPQAPPVEVLPKAAAVFVSVRHKAQRGGVCVVCGSNVLAGEFYLWSDQRQAGAHLGCGREQAPPARTTTAPRQRELPGARRQPQDENVGAVSDEERKLAEEVF